LKRSAMTQSGTGFPERRAEPIRDKLILGGT